MELKQKGTKRMSGCHNPTVESDDEFLEKIDELFVRVKDLENLSVDIYDMEARIRALEQK